MEFNKNYPAEVAILGDPKATLPELTAAVRAQMTTGARARARERFTATTDAISADRAALHAAARANRRAVRSRPRASAGDWRHAAEGHRGRRRGHLLEPRNPRTHSQRRSSEFLGLRGGGIGWGLPAAIGVKLALPDRPVVALIGDGSAMYTCQALWTAAHDQVPVVFVILNNASYRILKQRVHALRGHAAQTDTYVGMDLIEPMIDFVGLARSSGIAAERSRTVAETTDLIAKGLADGAPMLIDVGLERAFKPL